MTIGLISDTHSFLDASTLKYLSECDEIWHAGDIGSIEIVETLEQLKPLRAVSGNIDNYKIRAICPNDQFFEIEGVKVYMTHIGGYPGRYQKSVYPKILEYRPKIFISGHSHILKVINDKKLNLLHINPGACGHHGIHLMRTMIRFDIDKGVIGNMQVIELGKRGLIEE